MGEVEDSERERKREVAREKTQRAKIVEIKERNDRLQERERDKEMV